MECKFFYGRRALHIIPRGAVILIKKIMASIASALIAAAVILSACFALGAFDGDGVKYVEKRSYPTGDFTYSGGLRDGRFDGSGTINFDNGEKYIGGFKNGRLDGNGVYSAGDEKDGWWRFAGVFDNGAAESGTFYFPDGAAAAYERGAGDE